MKRIKKEVVVPPTRQLIADHFGLELKEVISEPQPDTYSVFIKDNPEAQEKYKEINKYGNTKGRPGTYNFNERQLIFWDGKKLQPA